MNPSEVVYAMNEETESGNICTPSLKLLDARTQLDLAVQASSVQAWADAAELVQDSSLDEQSLRLLFDTCENETNNQRQQLQASVLEAIRNMRELLSSKLLSTEDAMAVMKYGTNARVALDDYFGI